MSGISLCMLLLISDRIMGPNIVKGSLKFATRVVSVTLIVVFMKILSWCPPLFRWFHKKTRKWSPMGKTDYDIEAYIWSFTKFSSAFHLLVRLYWDSFFRQAEKNRKAPNPNVLTADGQKEVKLLDSAQPGRPLVLNFGSCS